VSGGGHSLTLCVRDVTVARGEREVVRNVSLDIPPGEITALLGPNGAGKSTLVLAVAGVLRVRSGQIMLGSQDLSRFPPEKRRQAGVAVVPEGRRLLPDLTVAENLQVATYAMRRAAAAEGIAYALGLFPELNPRLKVPGRFLSGGEQQMVVLAQAIASRPTTLLVDELSLGLAPVVVKRLVPVLAALAGSGVGVLLIEQFAHVALALANTAHILEGGRIRYHGTATELRENPDLLRSAYLLRAENIGVTSAANT
jgi:branched-chain amino acid transport system ATP-binding protein